MKVWITKYSLSNGGKLVEHDGRHDERDGTVSQPGGWGWLKIGRDCAASPEAALEIVEAARIKKLASLKAQIAKLEKLKFRVSA